MMEKIREGVDSIAVKIILGLIILTFVFAGVGMGITGGGNTAAATVGNTEIPRHEFEQAYQNERNRMQSQLGDYFSQLLADPSYVEQLRKSVLDRMINDVLLDQHAESLGLSVSEAEVHKEITNMEAFQQDGVFNADIFQAALRRAGFSPDSFAQYMRQEMVRQQLVMALQQSEFTLPSEVQSQGQLFVQTRDVRTLTLNVAEFASKADLTDEEIQQYYADNAPRFTRPEQVKVSYIELAADQLRGQVVVTDADVEQYYHENLAKFSSEEQRRVSHILVEGDDQAKAQAILDELNAGADFAALAEAKSDDFGSAELGGDLGFIERDVMDPVFEEAAFALTNVGDRTELVKTDFGYHIIQLNELKASEAKPLADVADEIRVAIVDQQAVDKFYELQEELERVAFESPDSLDDAAQAINQAVSTTDFISRVDAPQVLQNAEVMQAIESPEVREDGLNSQAIEIAPEHIIVVRVEDLRDEQVLPLEEVRSQAVALLSNVKGEQAALELATEITSALKEGNRTILEENALAFGELEMVDRRSPLAQTVFAMAKPEGTPVFGQTKDMQGNVVIVQLENVSATLEPAVADQVALQLQRASSQQDISAVLTVLRNNAEIEYFVVGN